MKRLTHAEFVAQAKAQGVPRVHVAYKCPVCGTIQSATSLINAGAGKDLDTVEKFEGFSCVGRWTKAGPFHKGDPAGKGCDWTLGGLFRMHTLEVMQDDKPHPVFELATPEEAQELQKRNTPTAEEVPA